MNSGFVERSTVLVAKEADGTTIDLASRETQSTRDLCGLFVEVFNEKLRVNRGESSFEPTALSEMIRSTPSNLKP